jgi:hypothetical protein
MGNREDPNDGREVDERDGVRKASSNGATNPEFRCHARIEWKATGAPSDRCERRVDLCHELKTETFTPFLVPCGRSGKLLLRLRLDPDGLHG